VRSRPFVPVSILLLTAAIAIIGGALAGGVVGYAVARVSAPTPGTLARSSVATPVAANAPRTGSDVNLRLTEDNAVVEAARTVGPSVVTVVNTVNTRTTRFGQQLNQTSLGSGVIIDERGFILTNEHVIRGTRDLSIVLSTGEQIPARLVGTDLPFTDLAVIKIEPGANRLVAAQFGDSDALVPGQRVIAIGSALGDFRNSVTQGIVSGLHRSSPQAAGNNATQMEDLIQTDAAINHGNSGGALLNAVGQVIGINTSVIRQTQAGQVVEGVGFAIPSRTAAEVARQLIERGKVTRPSLGLDQQTVTRQLAAFYGLPTEAGAYVMRVAANGPAAQAGLQEADIIVKIGDFELGETRPFLATLMRFQPGQRVPITIYRGNRQQVVTVTLGEN
jgi:2-alkenal reductase